ncbi:guanylate kinase, partial [Bacteroidota bacterium]
MKGKAIVFSAPSGSGKTTIVQSLLLRIPVLSFSISATSRKKRDNETNGMDYYFLSEYDFRKKIDYGEFVEWEEVYDGCYYGTLKTEVDRIWKQGKVVVFDVDVKGGLNLKKYFGQDALAIFIRVKDTDTLKERLKNRKTETHETLNRRLDKAE